MKVWEKIAQANNLKDRKAVRAMLNGNCPASFEFLHNYINESRFKRFCGKGCSPICTDEYLDLRIKEAVK